MRLKTLSIILLVGFGLMASVSAQKIGYANIELILVYMPETKTMNQTLQTYEKKLGEQLQIKQQYAQQKYAEYLQLEQEGKLTATDKETREAELLKLDEDIQKQTATSQENLMKKRQDLLDPIVKKMQDQLKALATAEGYDYILNTVDGSGVSIVLHGPEEHDLTQKLMTRLGIKIPEGQ
ncbi:MAG: OmpH family outer membrane protein [Bacteroidia bacterium]|nr:OmpH family outer membrane protein [Bacteroidia bacterium]